MMNAAYKIVMDENAQFASTSLDNYFQENFPDIYEGISNSYVFFKWGLADYAIGRVFAEAGVELREDGEFSETAEYEDSSLEEDFGEESDEEESVFVGDEVDAEDVAGLNFSDEDFGEDSSTDIIDAALS